MRFALGNPPLSTKRSLRTLRFGFQRGGGSLGLIGLVVGLVLFAGCAGRSPNADVQAVLDAAKRGSRAGEEQSQRPPTLVAASFVRDSRNARKGQYKDAIALYFSESIDPLSLRPDLFAVTGQEGQLYSIDEVWLDNSTGPAVIAWLEGDFGDLGARHGTSVGLHEMLFARSGQEFAAGHQDIDVIKDVPQLRALYFEKPDPKQGRSVCSGHAPGQIWVYSYWDRPVHRKDKSSGPQVQWNAAGVISPSKTRSEPKEAVLGSSPLQDLSSDSIVHRWCVPWPTTGSSSSPDSEFSLRIGHGNLVDMHNNPSSRVEFRPESFEFGRMYWLPVANELRSPAADKTRNKHE